MGMEKAECPQIRGALFSPTWTERQEAGFGACKLPREAADPPRKVRRLWVTPAESALAIMPRPGQA